ncbi:MAG TPA: hypothetical protein VIH18_00810, partial [Candidatus Binatia bacterium]
PKAQSKGRARRDRDVSLTELRNGSRGGQLPEIRVQIVRNLVENYGMAIADVARQDLVHERPVR